VESNGSVNQLRIGEAPKEVLNGEQQTVMPANYNIPKPEPAHCRGTRR